MEYRITKLKVEEVLEGRATAEFINKYSAVVEYWENGEIEYATPIVSLEELWGIIGEKFSIIKE